VYVVPTSTTPVEDSAIGKRCSSKAAWKLWTIDSLKAHKLRMIQGYIKVSEPKEVRGVVDYPIWDFIDVSDYIYPVLHGEIVLANALLENIYDFLYEKVEVLSQEEVMQQIVLSLQMLHLRKQNKG
jgi:hypothetical protein